MKPVLSGLEKHKDFGLLVLRVVIGLTYIHFGWMKLMGGPTAWDRTGAAIRGLGITFGERYWGLAATFAELLGGVFLVLGFLTRPAAIALFGTMVVATVLKLQTYAPNDIGSVIGLYYPLSMAAVTFALIFVGGGKFGLESGGGSKGASESKPKK
jgi:putative oxidoreductase